MKPATRLALGRSEANTSVSLIGSALAFGLLYATLIGRDAAEGSLADFSLASLNNGIALSACILLTCGITFMPLARLGFGLPKSWTNSRNALGMTGFLLVMVHALISFLLFNSSEYGVFFNLDGSITNQAGLGMFCGVVALVLLSAHNLSFQTFLRVDRRFDRLITSVKFLRFAVLLATAHLVVISYGHWLAPGGWPNGMPPVSLLACVVLVLGISISFLAGE